MQIEIISTEDESDDHILSIDLDDLDQEEAQKLIDSHLAKRRASTGGGHNRYHIVDCTEGPEGLGEHDLKKACAVQAVINDHNEWDAVAAWCAVVGLECVGEKDKAPGLFQDIYRGSFNTVAEFAESTYEGMCDIPDCLSIYINWEAAGNNLMVDHEEQDGHYFRRG